MDGYETYRSRTEQIKVEGTGNRFRSLREDEEFVEIAILHRTRLEVPIWGQRIDVNDQTTSAKVRLNRHVELRGV